MTSDIHPVTLAGIIIYGIPTVAFLIFATIYPSVLKWQGRSFFNSQDEVFYYFGFVAVTSIFWPTLLLLCLISGVLMLPSLLFKGLSLLFRGLLAKADASGGVAQRRKWPEIRSFGRRKS